MVTYVPTKDGMSDAELSELSQLLNIPEAKLREKIEKVKSSYIPTVLANDLTQDIVTKIEERRNELPGISIDVQPIRYYPYNEMAAQIFGYVGQIDEDDQKRLEGQEGVSNITQIGRAGWKRTMTTCSAARTAAGRSKSTLRAVRSRKWNERIP